MGRDADVMDGETATGAGAGLTGSGAGAAIGDAVGSSVARTGPFGGLTGAGAGRAKTGDPIASEGGDAGFMDAGLGSAAAAIGGTTGSGGALEFAWGFDLSGAAAAIGAGAADGSTGATRSSTSSGERPWGASALDQAIVPAGG